MKKIHSGSCHCGCVRFEVDADIDYVRVCDWAVCRRRGALICRIDEEDLRIISRLEDLACYEWGSRTAKDYFCPTCGILPFRRPSCPTGREWRECIEPFHGWPVNTRCLDDFDYLPVPKKLIFGSRISFMNVHSSPGGRKLPLRFGRSAVN